MLPISLAVIAVGQQGKSLPSDGSTFAGPVTKVVQMNYLVSLPEGYEENLKGKYPLLLFLHGVGERGNDLNALRVHGMPKEIAKGRKFPFIVISPQCPITSAWDTDVLTAMLNDVEKKYRIDKKREYLTGLSMGGYGTWALAIATPKRFAAIAPICGGGDTASVGTLKDIPVWVTHGDADPVVPLAGEQAMVDALRAAGGNVRFDIVKGGLHDVWTPVYEGTQLYDWLLQHHR